MRCNNKIILLNHEIICVRVVDGMPLIERFIRWASLKLTKINWNMDTKILLRGLHFFEFDILKYSKICPIKIFLGVYLVVMNYCKI